MCVCVYDHRIFFFIIAFFLFSLISLPFSCFMHDLNEHRNWIKICMTETYKKFGFITINGYFFSLSNEVTNTFFMSFFIPCFFSSYGKSFDLFLRTNTTQGYFNVSTGMNMNNLSKVYRNRH